MSGQLFGPLTINVVRTLLKLVLLSLYLCETKTLYHVVYSTRAYIQLLPARQPACTYRWTVLLLHGGQCMQRREVKPAQRQRIIPPFILPLLCPHIKNILYKISPLLYCSFLVVTHCVCVAVKLCSLMIVYHCAPQTHPY